MANQQTKQRRPNPLKAVVLDWAGTTVDFGCRAPVLGFVAAMERRGIQVAEKQVRQFMGRAKRDHIRAMLELDEVVRQWRQVFGTGPQAADVEAVYLDFVSVQDNLIRDCGNLIPGCVGATAECRRRGLKIGSSTGYFREQMDILAPIAAGQGYEPDALVCANDIPAGRPAPWEIFENAKRLDVYPMDAIVKVDDTVVGVEAGINAGTWTIGITEAGNLIGLSESELAALDASSRRSLVDGARDALSGAGAHDVVASIAELPAALDRISIRIEAGERP